MAMGQKGKALSGQDGGAHEEMRGEMAVRGAQLVREALRKALHGRLARVVRGVATARQRVRSARDRRGTLRAAHGGFVMPCLEPVLMIRLGFSWHIIAGTNVCCT